MPRVMVTGAGGFVGRHVLQTLRACVEGVEVVATSRKGGFSQAIGPIEPLDVTDRKRVAEIIRRFSPTHVIHLAGTAALPAAAANPDETWKIHLDGTLNVARAILEYSPRCLLIYAGSGQVYGTSARSEVPMDEATLLAPTDAYTTSKAAADLALGAMARGGLRCIRFRPFNHIGPGQSEDFAVASFAMQIARIQAGLVQAILKVGNLGARRDFLDVRDVAAAYVLAVSCGDRIPSGSILNLASGVARPMSEVLDMLISVAGIPIRIEVDKARLRANDIPLFVGDARKAREILGWRPRFPLEVTLRDTLEAAAQSIERALV